MRSSFFGTSFLIVSSLFFLIGGLGYRVAIVQDFGIFASATLVFLAWIMNGYRFVTPRYFWIYMLFVVIVGWDVITRGISFDSPKFFSLILAGGLYCLSFYMVAMSRYGEEILQKINYYLLGLGWIFYLGYEWFKIAPVDKDKFSFGFLQSLTFEHNHLGVYWAILLSGLLLIKTRNNFYAWYKVFSILLGGYLVVISQSRSAYLLLLVAIIAFYKDKMFKKASRAIVILTAIATMLGIGLISLYKPIRLVNFYLPAVYALQEFPLGVSMGNFREVSAFYSYLYGSVDYVSTLTHNLFFEMTIGVGVFGFIYWVWYVLVVRELFKYDQNYFLAVFVAISALFMVDPGYVIPTLYWLWMAFLGMGLSGASQVDLHDLQT